MIKILHCRTSKIIIVLLVIISASCNSQSEQENLGNLKVVSDIIEYEELIKTKSENTFIDIKELIPGIVLDIRYATKNNFTGQKIYESPEAFIRKPVANALSNIQNELKNKGLGLKIFDAYRPYSATIKLYNVYPDKTFVAPPSTGSVHNRGCAVDLTIIDLSTQKELEMPSPFDDFTKKSYHSYKDLPLSVIENRELLKNIMTKHGFILYQAEWWHYDYKGWENFEITDISFKELRDCEGIN